MQGQAEQVIKFPQPLTNLYFGLCIVQSYFRAGLFSIDAFSSLAQCDIFSCRYSSGEFGRVRADGREGDCGSSVKGSDKATIAPIMSSISDDALWLKEVREEKWH